MTNDADDTKVQQSVEIKAPVERVWRALVDADTRRGWWSYLDLDPVVGGQVKETWEGPEGANQTTGVVTELAEGSRLAMDWADDGWPASTHVEFTLRATESGTVVQVRESGLDRIPDGDTVADEHRAGWQMHLTNLRKLVERG
ncbi:SRPBCC domain-containing protein [Micromonospora sp. NPDC126480]|uniref:SRPBCC family protein n=1 Tax=Micromonospora sp. NPDC126480 TaxID=3155312 RepID=UPI0033273200